MTRREHALPRMPRERLARLIAGVRSAPVVPITKEELDRRREAEGADALGCLCCGDPDCYFAQENVQ